MKTKLIVSAALIALICGYFILYYRNKDLKFIPENADIVILIDMKKAARQYISNVLSHPSKWTSDNNENPNTVSLAESGVKIPDFLQIFHIGNTSLSDWYCILELKDKQKLLTYLKSEKFTESNNVFHKDHVFIRIVGQQCILETSSQAFDNIKRLFPEFSHRTPFTSDLFINRSLGSISFISNSKIHNFSIDVNADDIEIKTASNQDNFTSILSKVQQKTTFLNIELDAKNIKNLTSVFGKNFTDSVKIDYVKATAELQAVHDTVITYGYDNDFNEIEKKTIQKIIQPNYFIALQSSHPEQTEQYFQERKWVNAQNQFTVIPFQPNVIEKKTGGFEIKSKGKPVRFPPVLNENYIFIKNNPSLFPQLKLLSVKEKRMVSAVDYIFYGNKDHEYYIKLKFKENNLPLLLRW
ncbi:hypothetical protein MKJ01_17660 [Chryseobacterium sp. SSA4.19]|uniref:hypothetical protein n=1 Tax=Chryseobacterium sp. SSA4.19 TaxID=2919915 RepID=UPI001F4E2730|nr:hypothetical protein [Chryseobacterium sp. SSA4.19]MCJ8155587.1 hypothetical protein [Chryseobacterium sp. SSA4.19]